MTNVLMAEEEGANLNEGNLVTANLFSRMIQDDKKMIEFPSEDKLPEGLEKLEWFNNY